MSITIHFASLSSRPYWRLLSIRHHILWPALILLAACGGSDSGSPPNSPVSTPMALVMNQDDTSMTTLRLDGKGSPVISTLSLGPVQSDEIGGASFSIGEWIFVTHRAANRVAFIDPIGGPAPILEGFLEVNGPVMIGQRPSRIYRDPVDKEVLWTMNEGDPVTGIDTLKPCAGGSVSVVHNSHLLAGGQKPHVVTTSCLSGVGEHFIAFSRPPAASQEIGFVSSKTTGLVETILADPSFGNVRYSPFIVKIDLCDSAKETLLGHPACDGTVTTLNHSAPASMFWSNATGKIYSYLSGYKTVIEIDPASFAITRTVDITPPPPSQTLFHSVGITPNGRSLLLVGEDLSDPLQVIGRLGSIDLTAPVLSATELSFPQFSNIRLARFQFTPDGVQLYMTQSNETGDLTPVQAQNLRKDLLFVIDSSSISLVSELALPPAVTHGMDLWITGPHGAGSAEGVVVTNATPGVSGTVTLIDAASHRITATINVGRNPKHVTVYYVGLAASDNQATPTW